LLAAMAPQLWAAAPSLAPASGADNGNERRAALVIGNSAYKVGVLKNPVNDAQAVAGSLRGLGFDGVLRENTALRDMIEAVRQFSCASVARPVRPGRRARRLLRRPRRAGEGPQLPAAGGHRDPRRGRGGGQE